MSTRICFAGVWRRIPMAVLACSVFVGQAALAQVTDRDLQVVARTLGFLAEPPSGALNVGIVFDPANAASRRQAGEIAAVMEGGLRSGNLTLRPVQVPLAEAGTAAVDFFLLTETLGESAAPLQEVADSRRLPCVTTDVEQVRSGLCAIGVRSQPRVEILVHRDAAASSGVAFSTVFRMMITEL